LRLNPFGQKQVIDFTGHQKGLVKPHICQCKQSQNRKDMPIFEFGTPGERDVSGK
jgi:hypothetical protein